MRPWGRGRGRHSLIERLIKKQERGIDMTKLIILALATCCACGMLNDSVSIQPERLASTSHFDASSFSGKTAQLATNQGDYIAFTAADIRLDTAKNSIRITGTVDSVGYSSKVYRGEHLKDVSVAIVGLRKHLGDSSWAIGYALDSSEQIAKAMRRNELDAMSIQEKIKYGQRQNISLTPYVDISPIAMTRPERDEKFQIEAIINRDSYLMVAFPHGPANFRLIGGLLPGLPHK